MHEDFSGKAFGYASVEVVNWGERDRAWYTDGGASLLVAGVTIFGSHDLLVKARDNMGDARGVTYAQQPGPLS